MAAHSGVNNEIQNRVNSGEAIQVKSTNPAKPPLYFCLESSMFLVMTHDMEKEV